MYLYNFILYHSTESQACAYQLGALVEDLMHFLYLFKPVGPFDPAGQSLL